MTCRALSDAISSAERFWRLVGFEDGFPRNLESVVALALPLSLVRMSRLSPSAVMAWLDQRGVSWSLSVHERLLHGCLVAHKGHGIIFLDGALPEDEFRFCFAHEVAHFLLHYHWPRESVCERLGVDVLPILDGERAPTPAERLSGLLRGVPLGPRDHLLERNDDGTPTRAVLAAETEADLLAFELVAPARRVLETSNRGSRRRRELVRTFGLPEWAAEHWCSFLSGQRKDSSFISRLTAAAEKYS